MGITKNPQGMSRSQYRKAQKKARRIVPRALKRQGGVCFWCKAVLSLKNATADHHPIPLREGGRSISSNIKAACAPCNQLRDATPPGHHAHIRAWKRRDEVERTSV